MPKERHYECHMLVGGAWSGIVEDGIIIQEFTRAFCNLSTALSACDRHAKRDIVWTHTPYGAYCLL